MTLQQRLDVIQYNPNLAAQLRDHLPPPATGSPGATMWQHIPLNTQQAPQAATSDVDPHRLQRMVSNLQQHEYMDQQRRDAQQFNLGNGLGHNVRVPPHMRDLTPRWQSVPSSRSTPNDQQPYLPAMIAEPFHPHQATDPVMMDHPMFPEVYHQISGQPRQASGFHSNPFVRDSVEAFHSMTRVRPMDPQLDYPHMAYRPGPPTDPATVIQPPALSVTSTRAPSMEMLGAIHQTQQMNQHILNERETRRRIH